MRNKYWGESNPDKKAGPSGKAEKHIAVQDSKIYYYAGVNRESAAELNKKLGEIESKRLNLSNTLDIQAPPIRLLVNSGGGSITAGISCMDTILRSKVPVHTYVDGFAASAATFITVVGNKRFMSRNSYMLIHQLSSSFWGTYANFEDEKKNLDLMMKTIKKVYKEHTNVPMKDLNNVLKHDLLWDAQECLHFGLIDEIV